MYRTILVATFAGLLLIALAAAGLAWMGAASARYELERTRLAHAVLESHLVLETETYLLLNRLTESLVPGAGVPDVATARVRLDKQIEVVRRGIAEEAVFVGANEDEAEELERLASIERLIGNVLDQMQATSGSSRQIQPPGDGLTRLISQDFRSLVAAAVLEEQGEVRQANEAADRTVRRIGLLSQVAAAAAVLLCAGALAVLLQRLSAPLADLTAAMRAVAAGDLSHQVPVRGRDEFAGVAERVNRMIGELAEGRQKADGTRHELETAIGQRTSELAEANLSLRRADETRRRFLADISHELRTPLTVIRGEAEVTLLGRGLAPGDYETALSRINEQAILTGRLVDDLLFVARVEAGEPRMLRNEVVMGDVAQRAAASAEVIARRKDVSIECREEPVEPVRGDPSKLRQLVMILLDNAIRYSNPRTNIEVFVGPAPTGVVLRVTDEGMGIAEDEVELVFERFYRGGNAAGQHADGSGLGLAMAKAIVEAHRGQVSLDSKPGYGTTVTVVFPVAGTLSA